MPPDDDESSIADEWVLPRPADRDWLNAGLARVLGQIGIEAFLRAPILTPEARWFPDEVPSGAAGLRVGLRRLMTYAGLGEARVVVSIGKGKRATMLDQRGMPAAAEGAAAWFSGWEGESCRFGVDEDELDDPEGLMGTLAHEVCHAFRSHHRVQALAQDKEELLTDVTAVVIGFGVLLLNSSYRYRTGVATSGGDVAAFSVARRGYLTPGQIAWILAAQVHSRGEASEARRIAGALSPNQRELFEQALEEMKKDPLALGALEIPARSDWPPPRERLIVPLAADDGGIEELPPNRERPVVHGRLETRSRAWVGVIGAGAIVSCASYFPFLEGWTLVGVLVTGCGLGALAGHLLAVHRCSECRSTQRKHSETCSECGAVLDGQANPEQETESEPADEALADLPSGRAPDELAHAIFIEWTLQKELTVHEDVALIVRAQLGQCTVEELNAIWEQQPAFAWLNDEGKLFFDWYRRRDEWTMSFEAFDADWAAANVHGPLEDTPAHRRRFAAFLDRRWEEWHAGRRRGLWSRIGPARIDDP